MLETMGWKQGDGLGVANQGETKLVSDGMAAQMDRIGTRCFCLVRLLVCALDLDLE